MFSHGLLVSWKVSHKRLTMLQKPGTGRWCGAVCKDTAFARVSWYCPLVRADSWLLVATRIEQWILERLSFHRLGYDGTGICGSSRCMGRSVAGRVMAGMPLSVPAKAKARVAISSAAHVTLTMFFRGFLI